LDVFVLKCLDILIESVHEMPSEENWQSSCRQRK
jgi:hypothetical protein